MHIQNSPHGFGLAHLVRIKFVRNFLFTELANEMKNQKKNDNKKHTYPLVDSSVLRFSLAGLFFFPSHRHFIIGNGKYFIYCSNDVEHIELGHFSPCGIGGGAAK